MKKYIVGALAFFYAAPVVADWDFHANLGLTTITLPLYAGDNNIGTAFLPQVDVQYGPFVLHTFQGAGLLLPLESSRTLIVNPAVRWRTTRNLSGDQRDTWEFIQEMRPVVSFNTILNFDPILLSVRVAEGVISDNRGATVNFGITYRNYITERLHLTLIATAIYGMREYMQTYFGITQHQSNVYGFDVHNPNAGWRSVGLTAMTKYHMTDNWSWTMMGELSRLVDAAANSTIVREKNQFMVGTGVVRRF
ncbi:MAG: MipA/OmpV family protein [Alphaproteobacteria bacterium]|nr:MipA/OmpV family protein [Alphaproteobacteria bacterium]